MKMDADQRFIYEFGKFVLDSQEKTLLADGRPIHLPAKEFETLLLLVENNGRALSKEEMLEAVWQDTFVEENNLAKYVSRLRKILDQNGQQYIETLPKHGYRFSAEINQTIQPAEETILEKRTIKRLTVRVEEDFGQTRLLLSAVKKQFSNPAFLAVLGLVIVASALGLWAWSKMSAPVKITSIAVLPLRSLTGEENNKALGMGLTDALITKLGSLQTITVRPTSAVVKFAGMDLDALEIGRKLKADAVLEGTIQQAEGRLRVTARLLRVADGEQIWTEKFDEPANRIFALQDALSNKIVKSLAFELKKSELDTLASRPTENPEAYEKYLRGRFYQSQNDERGFLRSIEFYEQAIAIDTNFAEPYAGIADAYLLLYNFSLRPGNEVFPKARQSVNRALQLNPGLPGAYNSLALIQFLSEHNWQAAEQSLQKAISLDPNNADAFLRYGYFLIDIGKFDEALVKLERARELNPLSPIVQTDIGLAYLCARRYPEAIEQLEKVTADNPEFPLPHWFLGAAFEGFGDPEKAFAANLRGLAAEGEGELGNRLRAVKETEGVTAANQLWLEESLKARKNGYVSALNIASLYATLKDHEQTLEWLEKALEEGERTISRIKYVAKYDFVRGDERFRRLLEKIEFK